MTVFDENKQLTKPMTGGVANAGAVSRAGSYVFRPAGKHTSAVHALLRHLSSQGFTLAPTPIGIENGEECLGFIAGETPQYPYQAWCTAASTLVSIATLMRQYHDAQASFVAPPNAAWCTDLADPHSSNSLSLICHNDVRPENIVFSDGKPVGLLDFDFAAPGRPVWDIARATLVWIPIDVPELAHAYCFGGLDPFKRLRLFCDSYGLAHESRPELIDAIQESSRKTEAFVRSQVEAGKTAFVEMWQRHHLDEIYARRQIWLAENKIRLLDELNVN